MDDPNITIEEYIRLEEEKARKSGKVYNWETTTYVNMPSFSSSEPTVSYFDDFDYFKDFEKEFSAIAYNDALTSKLDFSKPTGYQEEREEHVNVENVVELESNIEEKPKKNRATRKRSLVWGHYESFLNDQGEKKRDQVAYLKSKFANWEKSVLEGKWLHVHCTAHVMKLIVQDGLSHIGKSVECVRAAVKYNRQSPQRAFARYDSEDRHYRDDLEKTGVPISSEWANVRRLTKFLEHFYELSLKVSGILYVTLNRFLDDITSIDTDLNNFINGVPDTNLVAMAKMMKCKFDKYYGSLEKCNMAIVVASMLDLRNKFEYVEIMSESSPETHTMFEHVDPSSSTNKRSRIATPVIEPLVILKQKVRMEMKRRKSESVLQDSKSELDRYLNEDVEDESDKFDILNWWKVNSPRFPVLSLLARDVLVISISMVASESVFSTGGSVLDAFRSSLTPVVKSLICTQDWFREISLLLDVDKN
nr:hypothetical protein [Tanacetum cinerariifolium]